MFPTASADPEEHAHAFIYHVTDADRGRDFEEVRRQSPVEASDAVFAQYAPEECDHVVTADLASSSRCKWTDN